MNIIEIAVRNLRPGDKVVDKGREVYTIESVDAIDRNGLLVARITWRDGDRDIRGWDGDLLDQRIDVLR